MSMQNHLKNREWVAAALAGEIFGPGGRYADWKNDLYGADTEIDINDGHVFPSWEAHNARHVHAGTLQEILKDEGPLRRYGVGILYPKEEEEESDGEKEQTPEDGDAAAEAASGVWREEIAETETEAKSERKLTKALAARGDGIASIKDRDGDDVPGGDNEQSGLQLARLRRPRSMGVTCALDCTGEGFVVISVEGARYRPITGIKARNKSGEVGHREHTWWVRVPIQGGVELSLKDIRGGPRLAMPVTIEPSEISGLDPLQLTLEIIARPIPPGSSQPYPDDARLVTVTLVNRTTGCAKPLDRASLFQARFKIKALSSAKNSVLLPLPRSGHQGDEEQQSLDLLYDDVKTFASGHGCAGDWEAEEGAKIAACVIAEPIPFHDAPPVTPNLIDPGSGQEIKISMAPLARGAEDWMSPLENLATLYEKWIEAKRASIPKLDSRHHSAATRHIEACSRCAARIRAGIGLLKSDGQAALAFRLTNEAVLLQQLAGLSGTRTIKYDPKSKLLDWDKPASLPDLASVSANERRWRPFQIAFLLMSLPGLWDPASEDRDIADLIWFPTGGGKTEAYLAATAFALFAQRLRDPGDDGTCVLMRYTLRLLTSQQFQRAAGLMCAMEQIRARDDIGLGDTPFRIGIWVGGGTTPNSREQSIKAYKQARKEGPDAYAHVLLRCPWCGSSMGPRKNHLPSGHGSQYLLDGLQTEGTGDHRHVKIHCPDAKCPFHRELPVRMVDDEIYEHAPSLIIGTVDKFAMLAWRPQARTIFGLGSDGDRTKSPPALIIQDELHLITGPLGSMVGLYEGLIDELCSDRRDPDRVVRPKLVASTATTRASTRQISDLYARRETAIFPPPGLKADDSFFAKYDRDGDGKIKPGRMYLGVLARAYGSGLTVNVRVFSALLAAAYRIVDPKERDPWWTLLVFHNSIRELGAGLTLFGADIPERLKDIRDRWHPGENRRYLDPDTVLELTGRLSNSEVPRALEKLERSCGTKPRPLDACLASNIIEVGVDVPRLGLMAVSGQPKNSAQYIQATGRIGRRLPGLVVMVYDNRKARDLSHYEHFRDYHARLYASVEPASVTPFTLQVLERAVHGVFVAWARQQLPVGTIDRPWPIEQGSSIAGAIRDFAKAYLDRIRLLMRDDPSSLQQSEKTFKEILRRRLAEWGQSQPETWENRNPLDADGEAPLLRYYGEPCAAAWEHRSWETPSSMRGVDAECPASVVPPSIEMNNQGESVNPASPICGPALSTGLADEINAL